MGVGDVTPDTHEKTRPFVHHTLYTHKITSTHNVDRLCNQTFIVSLHYQNPHLTVPPLNMYTRHEAGLTTVLLKLDHVVRIVNQVAPLELVPVA